MRVSALIEVNVLPHIISPASSPLLCPLVRLAVTTLASLELLVPSRKAYLQHLHSPFLLPRIPCSDPHGLLLHLHRVFAQTSPTLTTLLKTVPPPHSLPLLICSACPLFHVVYHLRVYHPPLLKHMLQEIGILDCLAH